MTYKYLYIIAFILSVSIFSFLFRFVFTSNHPISLMAIIDWLEIIPFYGVGALIGIVIVSWIKKKVKESNEPEVTFHNKEK